MQFRDRRDTIMECRDLPNHVHAVRVLFSLGNGEITGSIRLDAIARIACDPFRRDPQTTDVKFFEQLANFVVRSPLAQQKLLLAFEQVNERRRYAADRSAR